MKKFLKKIKIIVQIVIMLWFADNLELTQDTTDPNFALITTVEKGEKQ